MRPVKPRMTSTEMPASLGLHGPGEMTIRSRRERGDLVDGERVVAIDAHVLAQLAEVLDEVVGERVVVIDHQQHGYIDSASLTAWNSARALLTHSACSRSGSESATIPAPACA